MALPLPLPPGPGGYFVDSANALNALSDAQLKTAGQRLTNQKSQFQLSHPGFMAKNADAQGQAYVNWLQENGHPNQAAALKQIIDAKTNALAASANYHNVYASLAPQRVQNSQTNTGLRASTAPGAAPMITGNSQLSQAHNALLQNAIQRGSGQNAPTTQPIYIPPVQNGQAISTAGVATGPQTAPIQGSLPVPSNPSNASPLSAPSNAPAPSDPSNVPPLPPTVAPPGASVNNAVPGMPNALTPVDPDKLSDQDFNARKDIVLSDIKKTTTAKTFNRIEAGVALENLLNSPQLNNAFDIMQKYQGAYGAGFLKEAQGWAQNDPRYQELQSARNQFNGIISGSLSALEGYPSTDHSVKMAKQYFQSAQRNFNMSPEQAKADLAMGKSFARAEVESLMSTTPYQIGDIIHHAQPTPPTPPSMTRVVGPDGKLYNIPLANLEKAKARGFKETM